MKLAWDSQKTIMRQQETTHYDKSDALYHSARWTALSRRFRQTHPLCEECRRKGIIKEAQCVDHIVPFPICKDFFDESNLQSLCNDCNRLKGIKDRETVFRKSKQNNQR